MGLISLVYLASPYILSMENVKQLDVAATGRSPVVRKARIAVQAAPGAAIAGAACPAEEPLLLR